MKTKTNVEEEEQKEDYLSVDIYDDISILPTAWCPLNENFYTVNIYWKKIEKKQIIFYFSIPLSHC